MPRYYLHLCNSVGYLKDEDGEDFIDFDAALHAATLALREALAADIMRGKLNVGSYVEIQDSQHNHVLTLEVTDVLQVEVTCEKPF